MRKVESGFDFNRKPVEVTKYSGYRSKLTAATYKTHNIVFYKLKGDVDWKPEGQ